MNHMLSIYTYVPHMKTFIYREFFGRVTNHWDGKNIPFLGTWGARGSVFGISGNSGSGIKEISILQTQ